MYVNDIIVVMIVFLNIEIFGVLNFNLKEEILIFFG